MRNWTADEGMLIGQFVTDKQWAIKRMFLNQTACKQSDVMRYR